MIASVHNARVKAVVRLQRQGRERRKRGLFCIEAERELTRAAAAGFAVVELYYEAGWLAADATRQSLVERVRQAGGFVSEVSEPVLAKMAYREQPRGFVAVLRAKRTALADLQPAAEKLIVVCSGLEKPGNVGAIVRSAAGAGVAAVVLDRADFDLFNPNCVRASTGAVFGMPIVCAEQEAVVRWLRQAGRNIVALSPEATRPYTAIEWGDGRAIVLGAEAEGLDAAWRAAADELVAIPLAGGEAGQAAVVDSLNVSVAAAVVMFEARRRGGDF